MSAEAEDKPRPRQTSRLSRRHSMAGANIINNASKLGIGSFPTSSQPGDAAADDVSPSSDDDLRFGFAYEFSSS